MRSYRETEAKVAELRTECLDSIAELVLTLEDKVLSLEEDNEALRDKLAELEGNQ